MYKTLVHGITLPYLKIPISNETQPDIDAQHSKNLTVGFSLTTIMENSIEISSIPVLDNANYGEWSAQIFILLQSKDLLHVCENTLPRDATVPVTNKWKKANSEAISAISS
ncbi:hypothetical protein O181_051155 [Austropuccinia psidii MF-1]|uniref:Uncharacterized protein n=1 Tax=Austropuccinia psidii MF-1 TaxID=1389203 RepID=A0A9Q3DWL3_9BASI|nr:hypothetical protein [Austropuccinia psidii MF-1]